MGRKIAIIAAIVLILGAALFIYNKMTYVPPDNPDDDITLQIQFDIKEDVGLLLVDYDSNGFSGSGGTSNADKSLLKKDELIIYTLNKKDFKSPSDVKNITLQFTIITEYFDPNYDNVYPTEYTKPLDAVSLDVKFGEAYCIIITGDKTNGYSARYISENQ